MYKSGDTFRDEIYVYDADGTSPVTPDSIDAAVLVVNGTDTAVSVTTDTSTTGVVKVSCSLAGRSAGDEFWVRLTVTVGDATGFVRTAKGRIGVNVVEWGGFSLNPATSYDGGMAIVKAVDLNADALPNATTVAAIKAKTDNLPASPAAQTKLDTLEARLTAARAGYIDKLNVSGTLAHSDDADMYKADVSGLSTLDAAGIRTAIGLASANLDTQLGTIDGNVDAILVDTGTTLDGKLDVIDGVVDAIKVVTDKLDTTVESDGATGYQFTETALENAPAGGGGGGLTPEQATQLSETHDRVMTALPDAAPSSEAGLPTTGDLITPQDIDDVLSSNHGSGLWTGGTAGAGAVEVTYTINDTNENPIDGVAVWITTDEAGTNTVAGTRFTDAMGKVTFMLDAGTYYLWRQKSGYNFPNPQEIEVTE